MITLYAIIWNEEAMLPYFFRHYDQVVTDYVFYDHDSTDRSRQLIEAHPRTTIHPWDPDHTESVCWAGADLKATMWHPSKTNGDDLVIVCDIDEFLYPLDTILNAQKAGATVFKPSGHEMVHHTFPTNPGQIYDEVTNGYRSLPFDKICVFDPKAIDSIAYKPGCHEAQIDGRVVWSDVPLALLHMKLLGADYVHQRYQALGAKLHSEDIRNGYGHQYFWSKDRIVSHLNSIPTTRVVP